ncbi:hypothetical protein G6F70_008123 [Rhizopus microsporus]|uniref:Uncharacterized protein n=1 Tax=Rhizopus azygosporus TaxID=86630 RepID=A0A367JFM9_RHIAZ|nr:hypothetical protein G6F71_002232 [Rhizopus microsporus]RCH88730.1 hypothetical protein CU097_006694 [Rhizopus azygosporus]KAG1195580.1 hypothetical protein G6F70_008123 [Rhizopus microsporus]KAG1207413.1 hypothetical protein G6F69_008068 [Rhizopus microsporus]KAG1228086.1 hypothetical protein G6F67_008045 [Rhizopus microsporus]
MSQSNQKQPISKYAYAPDSEPKNAKERVQRELQLLHARKQAIDLKKKPSSTTATSIHKVKKGAVKKVSSSKKQKKIAKALAIADKEEKKLEAAAEKARKRKMGKLAW